jgi:hypothetical protein
MIVSYITLTCSNILLNDAPVTISTQGILTKAAFLNWAAVINFASNVNHNLSCNHFPINVFGTTITVI